MVETWPDQAGSSVSGGRVMIPFPDRVIIGHRTYTIERDGLDPENAGELDPAANSLVIRVEIGMKPLEEVDTLIHEIVHGIEVAYRIRIPERTVGLIAHGLTQLFRDNPQLLDWIAERITAEAKPKGKKRDRHAV